MISTTVILKDKFFLSILCVIFITLRVVHSLMFNKDSYDVLLSYLSYIDVNFTMLL